MATGGSESDEIANIKCNICTEKGRTRHAEKYCIECKNYYCSSCLDMHRVFPILKEHQLLDKANFGSPGSVSSLPSFPTERCSLHPGKIVDMFCKDHDEVACATCIAFNHRVCTNICYIPEDVNDIYNKGQQTNARLTTDKIKSSIAEIKTHIEAGIKELKNTLDGAMESDNAFAEEIKKLVENMAFNTIQELKTDFDKAEGRLQANLTKAEDILQAMDEIAAKLRRSEGNVAQEFVCIKSLQKVIKKAEEYKSNAQERHADKKVGFVADNSLSTFLKGLRSLGKVSSTKLCSPKTALYKVNKQTEIDTKLDDNMSSFWIGGSCITEDGFLLLTEYYNKKLKRIDLSTDMLKDYVAFQSNPRAVCQVSKVEAAVALENQIIQFVTLADTLTVTRTLTFNHRCYGLVHINDRLLISDVGPNVYIHNKDGQQVQKISPTNILQSTYHIAVSDAGDRIFIADYYKGLVILDNKGNHLSTVTDPSLSCYIGVCTDGSNVFLCGHNSNNIVQIGQDYKLMGEIAKVTHPVSLSFDRRNSRLIITNRGDKITIIELE